MASLVVSYVRPTFVNSTPDYVPGVATGRTFYKYTLRFIQSSVKPAKSGTENFQKISRKIKKNFLNSTFSVFDHLQ